MNDKYYFKLIALKVPNFHALFGKSFGKDHHISEDKYVPNN